MRRAVAACLFMVLGACSGSEAPRERDAVPEAADPGNPAPEVGDIGGVGAAECQDDAECREVVQREVEHRSAPPFPRDYGHGQCVRGDIGLASSGWGGDFGEPSCACGEERTIVLLSDTSPHECLWHGRGERCVYRTVEFPGCDLDDADSCNAICADLQARIDADAKIAVDGEVVSARCDRGACAGVLRLEDSCYARSSFLPQPCDKDPEQLIEDARKALEPIACEDLPEDAEGVTCFESEPPHGDECIFPRDPDEWQGALVDTCNRVPCETNCGLRLACVDNICTACVRDADCFAGEVCVLDQCLLAEKVECDTRRDCEPDVLCTLIDEPNAPAEPRGNAATWALCMTQTRLDAFLEAHGGGRNAHRP